MTPGTAITADPKVVDGIVDLCAATLHLGRTDRATFHPDGMRRESVTDHTVMLAVIAPALAAKLYENTLDVGKVAQMAVVHDFPEVYAGDTSTLRTLTKEQQAEKTRAEMRGLDLLATRFGPVFPWLSLRLFEYEQCRSPEARFVKAVDKILPKLTEVLNDGATCKGAGVDYEEAKERWAAQRQEMIAYAYDFPELMAYYDATIQLHLETLA